MVCGNERVTHQEATTACSWSSMQPSALAAVSACSLSAAYPTGRPRSPCPGRGANATATRQRPSTSVAADSRLQIPDRRLQTPYPKRVFTKMNPCKQTLFAMCDYQVYCSTSYYDSCTADLTLQISTLRWTPSTSTLKSLPSHRLGGALDRPTGSGDCSL